MQKASWAKSRTPINRKLIVDPVGDTEDYTDLLLAYARRVG